MAARAGITATGPATSILPACRRSRWLEFYAQAFDTVEINASHLLAPWAEWLIREHEAGRPIYVYFNNDVGGHAPRDATRLRALLVRRTRA